jgi:hypothetical protein
MVADLYVFLATPMNPCKPSQWVPSSICYAQFYQMCANGEQAHWWGKFLCQQWVSSSAFLPVVRGSAD